MVLYGREWNGEYDGRTPGHYTKSWNLALVGNTEKLYYAYIDDYWNDSYNQIAVVQGENWGAAYDKIGNRWNGGTGNNPHTDYIITGYSTNYWNTYFWNGKGASSLTHCPGGAADITKYTTTLNIKVKTSSGGSYANASTSNAPTTGLKITGSYINDDHRTEAVRSDAEWSEGSSCAYNSVVSGLVTVSYTSLGSDWQFDGWYINGTQKSTSSSFDFYQHANTTVEARFSRKYTVTYNADGGSVSPSSAQQSTAFSALTLPTPTKDGYSFDGWYNYSGTKIGNAGASYTPTSDITLYAHWNCTTPTFSKHPLDATVCKDASSPSLSVTASANEGSLSYQWYSNTAKSTSSPTPVALANCTTATYSAPTGTAGTKYYYCVVTNTTGSCSTTATSNIATVTVNAPVAIGTQPTSVAKANVGTAYNLSVEATGTGLTYQWYTCNSDGSSASAISSGTNSSAATATLSITPASAGVTYYKCVVSGTCGSQTSNVASITAKNAISPTLTYASTVTKGNTISPSLSGAGDGTVSYSLNGVDPANSLTINNSTGVVTGATIGGTATVTATIADGTNYWGGSATSSSIEVVCNPVAAPTSLSCSAQTGTTLTYTWTKASGASGYTASLWDNSSCTGDAVSSQDLGDVATVTFTSLSANTTYYCKVQSKGDGTTYCEDGGTTAAAQSGKTLAQYDLTFAVNPSGYGSVSETSLSDVDAGTTVSADGATLSIGATDVTASAADATSKWLYSFVSWTKSNGDALPSTLTGDLAVRANFTRTGQSYTITLDKQVASNSATGSVSATYGSAMPSIATLPEHDDYTFGGFYTQTAGSGTCYYNASGVGQQNSDFEAATTLYAKFSQTITLDDNGGTADGSASVLYNGTSATISSAPTYSGYTADGYYADDECEHLVLSTAGALTNYSGWVSGGKWIHDGASKLYAHYKCTAPEVSCTDNVVTMSTTSTGATIYYTTNGNTPTSSSTAYDPSNKPTIAANTTITAIAIQSGCTNSDVTTYAATYTPVYTVDFTLTNANKLTGETSVLENKSYTATFSEVTGYDLPTTVTVTIGGVTKTVTTDYTWSVSDGTGTLTILANKINGDVVITVSGTAETYTISYKDQGNVDYSGSNLASLPTSHSYGSATDFVDGVKSGYRFEGWYTDEECTVSAGSSIGATAITANTTYYAKWAQLYTITNGNPSNGTITVVSSAAEGDEVSISASGSTGYNFSSWSIYKTGDQTTTIDPADDDDASTTFTMPAYAVTVDATFEAKTYVGTIHANGGESAGSYTATYDATTLAITAPTKAGFDVEDYYYDSGLNYKIADVSGNLVEVAQILDPPTMYVSGHKWKYNNTDLVIYPKWTAKLYTITLDQNGATTEGTTSFTVHAGNSDYSTRTPLPERTGYDFNGYYTEASGGVQIFSSSGGIVGNVDGYTDENSKWTCTNTSLILYAHWTAKTYTVTLDPDNGSSTSSVTATYDAAMPSGSAPTFSGYDFGGYFDDHAGTGKQYYEDDMESANTWDKTSATTLYAKWTQSVILDKNGGTTGGLVTATYNGGLGSITAPVWSGYTVEGYYAESGCTHKVMEANGTLVNYSGYVSGGKWIKTDATTLYANWVKVIYRTGDNDGTDESFAGGTIPAGIEFRMKVNRLDYWYSLCLPFTVSAVKIWDEEDNAYYDLVPYYRTGGKYYTGHYIIRTPSTATGLAIADFDNWNDPSSSAFLPSKNTPYIIQWHDSYFSGKYISFFGAANQTIPNSMTTPDAPTTDNVVNVCVNNSMTEGSLAGVYMLDPDYGAGAWLRLEDKDESRTIPPFECFIRASATTTGKHLVIRRGITNENTATGIDNLQSDNVQSTEVRKVMIDGKLYIIRGERVYDAQGALVK